MSPRGNRTDLDTETLLAAYRTGFFPMAQGRTGAIRWYSPDPRAVIPFDTFHVPRSLRRILASGEFTVRHNTAFSRVIAACADREDTWISDVILGAYERLHRLGYAHSVEAWRGDELAGGLYGVALGGAFFGESMFSVRSGASKVALCGLVDHLRRRGFLLLDTQWVTPHLERFGAREVSRQEYLELLARALEAPVVFSEGSGKGSQRGLAD